MTYREWERGGNRRRGRRDPPPSRRRRNASHHSNDRQGAGILGNLPNSGNGNNNSNNVESRNPPRGHTKGQRHGRRPRGGRNGGGGGYRRDDGRRRPLRRGSRSPPRRRGRYDSHSDRRRERGRGGRKRPRRSPSPTPSYDSYDSYDSYSYTASCSRSRSPRREAETAAEKDRRETPQHPPHSGRPATQSRSFADEGRRYSLPPSPRRPEAGGSGYSDDNTQPLSPILTDSTVTAPAAAAAPLWPRPRGRWATPTPPGALAEAATATAAAAATTTTTTTVAQPPEEELREALLVFSSDAAYGAWLSGSAGDNPSLAPPSSRRRASTLDATPSSSAGVGRVRPLGPSQWEEVGADANFLVSSDAAALQRTYRSIPHVACAGGEEEQGEGEEGPSPQRDGSPPSPSSPAGSAASTTATDELRRCFRAHYSTGKAHRRPPWHISVDAADNHEHPYYLTWLDDVALPKNIQDAVRECQAALRRRRQEGGASSTG